MSFHQLKAKLLYIQSKGLMTEIQLARTIRTDV